MIHAVASSDPRFRTVHFGAGLNIVLAERIDGSSEKDSRNGLGKTSLIEIIHFCLGAGFSKNHRLAHPELRRFTYSVEIDLGPHRFTVTRCPEEQGIVHLRGPVSQLPVETIPHKRTGLPTLSVAVWNQALGQLMFGLGDEESAQTFAPTFRSLIGYFIRRSAHAFSQPFEHFSKQLEWDKQVNTAHILQLDWRYPFRWQQLREKKKLIKQLKTSAKSGIIPHLVGMARVGDLEAARVNLEDKTRREAAELADFKVHPQYRELEIEASQLTSQIHEVSNQNVSDRELLDFYGNSLRDETPAPARDVERLYAEAGVVLPGHVARRLEDVQHFHTRLIRNRREFIEDARTRLTLQITERDTRCHDLTNRRAALMSLLQTHGALEEYPRLLQRHMQSVAQLEDLRRRIDALRKFEADNVALKAERATLEVESNRDFNEHRTVLEKELTLFNQHSLALYDSPGRLIVEPKAGTGYLLDYRIDRKGSEAVGHMVVFCYDLMLARTWATRPHNPGILIHDSTLFDGADERQFTQALHLAHLTSHQENFQYLCCLNSDRIPTSGFPKDFDWRKFVKLTLADGSPDGGLFGFRFGEGNEKAEGSR
jgi:uncharacterized protein YydD (DUF2326 family)